MNGGWFSSATAAGPPPSLSVVNDKEGRLQTEHTHHNYYIHLTLNLQRGVEGLLPRHKWGGRSVCKYICGVRRPTIDTGFFVTGLPWVTRPRCNVHFLCLLGCPLYWPRPIHHSNSWGCQTPWMDTVRITWAFITSRPSGQDQCIVAMLLYQTCGSAEDLTRQQDVAGSWRPFPS